jgi:hypothetical protein
MNFAQHRQAIRAAAEMSSRSEMEVFPDLFRPNMERTQLLLTFEYVFDIIDFSTKYATNALDQHNWLPHFGHMSLNWVMRI